MRPLLYPCKVEADDPAFTHPGLDRCRVTICGDRIAVWVFQDGVWHRYDMLTSAVVDESDELVTVTGTSSVLLNQVGVPERDAKVKLTIRQVKGCKTCN